MAITIAAVKAYISFPSAQTNGPTDAEWTAWIAAAEITFESRTGLIFVEATKKHYDLFMTYQKLALVEWQIQQAGGVVSISTEGRSAVLGDRNYLRAEAARLEKNVMTAKTLATSY